jgi:hypothetical protein
MSSLSEESLKRIEEFVDKIMQDPAINSKYLPDIVEKQIYKNVLIMGLGMIKQILSTTEIRTLGHKITLTMEPLSDADAHPPAPAPAPQQK